MRAVLIFITVVILVISGALSVTADQEKPVTQGVDKHGNLLWKVTGLKEGKYHGTYRAYYPNGKPKVEGPYVLGLKHGVWTHYDKNGRETHDIYYHNDTAMYKATNVSGRKKTIPDGVKTEKYPNGFLKRKSAYLKGKRHGIETEWYPTGVKKKEIQWHNGQKAGSERHWFPNGKLKSDGINKGGAKSGEFTHYFSDGHKKNSVTYRAGFRHGLDREYSFDGVLIRETAYHEGVKTGQFRRWYENGKQAVTGGFDSESKKTGEWQNYYESGSLKNRGTYAKGKAEGRWTYYFENGKRRFEIDMKGGVRDGVTTAYYANGNMKSRVRNRNGKKSGIYEAWDREGNLFQRSRWQNGEKREALWMSLPASASHSVPMGVITADQAGAGYGSLPLDIRKPLKMTPSKKEIAFSGERASLTYLPESGQWFIGPGSNAKNRDAYMHAELSTLRLPEWYTGYRGDPTTFYRSSGDLFFLLRRLSEASTFSGDSVLDVRKRTLFSLPTGIHRHLSSQGRSIWLTLPGGAVRVDRESGTIQQYFWLPYLGHYGSLLEKDGTSYIGGALPFLQMIRGDKLTVIPIPQAIIRMLSRTDSDSHYTPKGNKLFLSNPVVREGTLYVSAFRLDEGGIFAWGTGHLLSYELKTGNWRALALKKGFRVSRLLQIEKRLWLLSSWEEYYEGGDMGYWGGVACMTADRGLQYMKVPSLPSSDDAPFNMSGDGMMISAYRIEPNTLHLLYSNFNLELQSQTAAKGVIQSIVLSNLKMTTTGDIVKSVKYNRANLKGDYQKTLARMHWIDHLHLDFRGGNKRYDTVLKQLRSLNITPRVLEISWGKADMKVFPDKKREQRP